jgi:deoxyribonuclease IV
MNLQVGFHVSIAGGISKSVDNALKIGCTAFQIFTRNPRGWTAKPLEEEDVKNFQSKSAKSGISHESVVCHMPYLPNLAAPDSDLYKKSVNTLAGEVQRCTKLGVPYLVIHLGSHLGKGVENGIEQIVNACNNIADNYNKSNQSQARSSRGTKKVQILLENMAGQKNSVGSQFEEIRAILDKLNDSRGFGVCLDTCHTFAAGFDLRKKEAVEKTLDQFDSVIGLKELKVLHLNDSKNELNSKTDRHEHIGLGKIGNAGFAALLKNKYLRNLPMIMETPVDKERNDNDNLKAVLKLAEAK